MLGAEGAPAVGFIATSSSRQPAIQNPTDQPVRRRRWLQGGGRPWVGFGEVLVSVPQETGTERCARTRGRFAKSYSAWEIGRLFCLAGRIGPHPPLPPEVGHESCPALRRSRAVHINRCQSPRGPNPRSPPSRPALPVPASAGWPIAILRRRETAPAGCPSRPRGAALRGWRIPAVRGSR